MAKKNKNKNNRKLPKTSEKTIVTSRTDSTAGSGATKAAPASGKFAPELTGEHESVSPQFASESPRTGKPTSPIKAQNVFELFRASQLMFSVAVGISILMLIAALQLTGGDLALKAVSGFPASQIPVQSAQVFIFLDSLFPLFVLSGFALLATSIQTRGNRPLVRLVLMASLVVLIADMAENAYVYDSIRRGEVSNLHLPLTNIKYCGIAFISILLSTILVFRENFERLTRAILRFVLPVAMTVQMLNLESDYVQYLVGGTMLGTLIMLALYAQSKAEQHVS